MPIKWNKQESDAIIEDIRLNPTGLRSQVDKFYTAGYAHVVLKRTKKREQHRKLLPTPEKVGKIYSRVIWKYMQLFMSLYTLDGMDVFFTPKGSAFNAQEVGNNANKVSQYDYEAMNKFEVDLDCRWNIGFYGLGAETLPGWDDVEEQPLLNSIDPLSIIPDPQDWKGQVKRFIGFEERFELGELRQQDEKHGGNLFDTHLIMAGSQSTETELNKQSRDSAQGYNTMISDDAVADVFLCFITYRGRKYFTKWANSRTLLIGIVEVEPRTKAQRKDISRVKFPIVLYRSKIIPGSFFGVSIPDETEQYQDQESILLNLEMILARKNAMGADRYINTKKIDIKSMNGKKPGGRNVPVKLDENENMNNAVWMEPLETSGQMPKLMRQELKQGLQEETGISSLAFGVSPEGNQTKAEIQSLTKNVNQLLSYSTTLIEKSEKEFWTLWYEYYIYNLPASSKKYIVLTKGQGISDSFEFKRSDFLLDYPVMVNVVSKAQESSRRKERFARRSMMAGTVLANLKQGSHAFNEYMRQYMADGEFTRDEYMTYFDYTPSETRALQGLDLLNAFQEKPTSPADGEDYGTFLNIYSLAKDSQAKDDIIAEYMDAYIGAQKNNPQAPEMGQVDKMGQAQAGNMVASEVSANNGSPEISAQA